MGKKSKDRGNPKTESVPESDSSTVFSKLFGHAPSPEPDAPTSLFSAHNPFRRKHGEDPFQLDKELGFELADPHPKDAGVELSKKDKKKKKRAKDEIDGADLVNGEKYKQVEGKESEIDGAMNPNSENGIPDSPIVTSDKEKKHKTKRDELEREYEEKKYGAAAGDEESKEIMNFNSFYPIYFRVSFDYDFAFHLIDFISCLRC